VNATTDTVFRFDPIGMSSAKPLVQRTSPLFAEQSQQGGRFRAAIAHERIAARPVALFSNDSRGAVRRLFRNPSETRITP